MKIKNISLISWGVLLLGLLVLGCEDDDKKDPVAPESVLTLKDADISFQKEGGTQSFTLSTNRGWTLARTSGEWLEIEGETTGEPGDVTISLCAYPYSGVESRKAELTVTAGTETQKLEIVQFGSQPEVIARIKTIKADCDGGVYQLVVNTNKAPLTPVSVDNWLTVTVAPYQSTSNMFIVGASVNSGQERSGKVIFNVEGAADTVTVVQSAYEPRCVITENRLNISALTAKTSVNVMTNSAWTLEWPDGKPAWLKEVTPEQGKAFETVKISLSIEQNLADGAQARSVDFIVKYGDASQSLTLAQAAPVISDNGTRELDSLALVEFYEEVKGIKPHWNFSLPMSEWGDNKRPDGTVNHDIVLNEEGRVEILELKRFTIEGEIPSAIYRLPMLTNLAFLEFTAKDMTFPEGIEALTRLKEFTVYTGVKGGNVKLPDLSGCASLSRVSVGGVNDFYSPEAVRPTVDIQGIAGMSELVRLQINYVNVGDLPDLSGSPDLEDIYIIQTDMTRFPDEIGRMTKLKSFQLTDSRLSGELPDIFAGMTSLMSFKISKNQMSGHLPMSLFTSPSLLGLYIDSNDFSGELPEELSTVSKIMQFVCRDNRLGGGEGSMLSEKILKDDRWRSIVIGGGVGGGWSGNLNICPQQPGYGWDNCK